MAKNRYNKSKKLFKSNKNKRHQLTKKKGGSGTTSNKPMYKLEQREKSPGSSKHVYNVSNKEKGIDTGKYTEISSIKHNSPDQLLFLSQLNKAEMKKEIELHKYIKNKNNSLVPNININNPNSKAVKTIMDSSGFSIQKTDEKGNPIHTEGYYVRKMIPFNIESNAENGETILKNLEKILVNFKNKIDKLFDIGYINIDMKPDNLVLNKNKDEIFFIDTDPLYFIKLDNLKKKYNNSIIEKLKIYNQFVAVYQLNLFLKQEILQKYLKECIEDKTINLLELVYYLFIIDNYIKEESHNSIYTNQQAEYQKTNTQPQKTLLHTIQLETLLDDTNQLKTLLDDTNQLKPHLYHNDSNYVLLTRFIEQYFYGNKKILILILM